MAQSKAKNPRRPNDPTMAPQLEQTNSLLHNETVPIRKYLTVINYTSSSGLFHLEDFISKAFVFYFF